MDCYKHFLGQFIWRQSPSRPQSPTQAKEDRAMRARKVMARLAAGQTNASQLGLPPLVPVADSPYQGPCLQSQCLLHPFMSAAL